MSKPQLETRRSLVNDRFSSDSYSRFQGFELEDVTEDQVRVGVTVGLDQTNFHGGTHGGVVFSLADCAFSLACNAYESNAVAIDTHMVFTASSAVGDRLLATATEISRGRTLGTYRVEVSRSDGRTVGLFTGTVLILDS